MDKRVLALPHINGDLGKVNIDPTGAMQFTRSTATISTLTLAT